MNRILYTILMKIKPASGAICQHLGIQSHLFNFSTSSHVQGNNTLKCSLHVCFYCDCHSHYIQYYYESNTITSTSRSSVLLFTSYTVQKRGQVTFYTVEALPTGDINVLLTTTLAFVHVTELQIYFLSEGRKCFI